MPAMRVQAIQCEVCGAILMIRGAFNTGSDNDWCMLKDRVWKAAAGKNRFLCIACIEKRLCRKLTHTDFSRTAKTNFVGRKSPKLRSRMRGLKPAKRLRETRFTW